MLLKHPVCYFEATHANSHGYYTITKCRAINDYYTFNNDICMEMSEMNVHYLDKSGYLRYAFVQALSAFEKLPLVGLTTSIGFMAWLTAVLGLWLARCKAKPVLPVFICLGIFWLTCIASPVNDSDLLKFSKQGWYSWREHAIITCIFMYIYFWRNL